MTAMEHFSELTDPRIERKKEHLLQDIIIITISAVICGAETWNDVERYGHLKQDWLGTFLDLSNGIPSHDTFNRVFSAIDNHELESCFVNWIKDVATLTDGEVVSIDGKSLRGSKQRGSKSIVHMVSAWANTNGVSLAQRKVDEKSNEITAIPKLLEVLALQGCIVTIDAIGCQTEIADKIVEKQADYILAVKGNQGSLEEELKDTIRFEKPVEEWEETDVGHGRIETRLCKVYTDFSHIHQPERWKNLKTLVEINAYREHKVDGKKESETRLYITSIPADAKKIGKAIRAHWGIENSLHWVLDVAFNEDKSRKRSGNSAENFSIINRIALNLIKQEKEGKRSIKGKRLDAGWDNEYLLKILKF
jgi:predicted transposase YbfD/YdcC